MYNNNADEDGYDYDEGYNDDVYDDTEVVIMMVKVSMMVL